MHIATHITEVGKNNTHVFAVYAGLFPPLLSTGHTSQTAGAKDVPVIDQNLMHKVMITCFGW